VRARHRSFRVVPFLAAALAGCSHAPAAILGLGPTFVLTFHDLSASLVPGAVEDDGDVKDVAIKGRASFKPSKGSDAGLDKRMKLKSKVDGGEASVASQVEMTGDVTSRLRVAVDSLDGLVDGVTLGFLERRAGGGASVKRLEAVWNAAIDGFTVRAFDNGLPAGATLDLPSAREAVLAIVDDGADFVLHAGEPTGDSITDLDPQADLATMAQEPSTEGGVFAFGAEGLGQKATIWLAQLTLEFGTGIAIGPAETELGDKLIAARQYLVQAQQLLDDGATGAGAVQTMYTLLFNAGLKLENSPTGAMGMLAAALENGTLAPSTQGLAAFKNTKTAAGWVIPAAFDMFDVMQSGGTSIKPVKSHVAVGLKKTELAIAQVAGFKSSSHGKLEKTLEFTIE
jgi:hypothetical protein